ncbi:response regulator transcription factor [Methylophaga sp. OBS4]|uniref:response regulator transcription factor n=1 Tax=Methylophaga sp. OBS4 TaxID=2991935 RepID=UPI00224D266D|nr:response regulator transcription factor [Methylophaga sp. OBS4]MCX4187046.1 response regulator transcription factor [Methylophaga sp. OBS4]
MKVLILDDDEGVSQLVERVVEKMGFMPIRSETINQASQLVGQADIAIVDINLPDGSGYDFAKKLRDDNYDIGIIILTVRDSTEDKVRGYIEGADIYLGKPFSPSELTAILYSLSRRFSGEHHSPPMWQLNSHGRFLLTPEAHKAELTERETAFLELLFNSERNLLSKRRFVEHQGYRWIEYDNRRLDTFISRMKKRIKEQTGRELPLKADRSGNYYFVSSCELINQ